MNASDLPAVPTVAQRIDAAFAAILAGRFHAPEVLDVLWGCVGTSETYWQLREERAWRMRIDDRVGLAQHDIRVLAAQARAALNRRFDDLLAAVDAARQVA